MKIKEAQRVESADVYRGFVMFLMMAEVLEFSKVSEIHPGNSFWAFLSWHQSHVAWGGCSLHDMIQPSFTFLVGVVLPYSISKQMALNTHNKYTLHIIKRSLILILLGVFLRSMFSEITNWTFEDTLSQIGLGYTFLYILAMYSPKVQAIACGIILVLYWAAFAYYHLPGPSFNYGQGGIKVPWPIDGKDFVAHWNKNTNIAWAFDRWFLNLFPRKTTFLYNSGGYVTLSFIPTLATMILGLLAGNILKSSLANGEKLRKFLIFGLILITAALAIHFMGICPIVKRIWTPSWVLFSGGICFLFLSIFYYIVDIKNIKKPFYWLKIIGMNSIAAYVMAHTVVSFIEKSFKIHFGENIFKIAGEGNETLVSGSIILAVLWLILNWMYNKKLFIRI